MQIVAIKEKQLVGLSARTKNADEQDKTSAKIPALWKKFYGDIYRGQSEDNAYGIYSDYESDHSGIYKVSAAVEQGREKTGENGLEELVIQEGRYMVFSTDELESPSVWGLWELAWKYFSSADSEYQRAYTTDFELFYPDKRTELYIAIE